MSVIDEAAERLAPLERAAFEAEWALATDGHARSTSGPPRRRRSRSSWSSPTRPCTRRARPPPQAEPEPLARRAAMRLRLAAAGAPAPARAHGAHRRARGRAALALHVHRCVVDGRELTDNEVDEILRTSTGRRAAAQDVGGDADHRRAHRPAPARGRAPAQRGGARARPPRPLRDEHGARRARRGLAVRRCSTSSTATCGPAWEREKAAIDDDVRGATSTCPTASRCCRGTTRTASSRRRRRRTTTRCRTRSPASTCWRPPGASSSTRATTSTPCSRAPTSSRARARTSTRSS